MEKIRFIKKVERTLCSNLNGLLRAGEKLVKIPADVVWESLYIKPGASLTIQSKEEDKNTIYNASLKFYTCDDVDNRKCCWKLTSLDGTQILLGTNERPFPVTSVVESIPSSVTENQLNEVTVSYSTNKSIPYIV